MTETIASELQSDEEITVSTTNVSLRGGKETQIKLDSLQNPGQKLEEDEKRGDFTMPPCEVLDTPEYRQACEYISQAVHDRSTQSIQYKSMLDTFKYGQNVEVQLRTLLALRQKASSIIAVNFNTHSHLIHLIFKMDPFTIPSSLKNPITVSAEEKRKNQLTLQRVTNTKLLQKLKNQFAEEERNAEENEKMRIRSLEIYSTFRLANAHLHLIVALVSANSALIKVALENLVKKFNQIDSEENKAIAHRIHCCISTLLNFVPLSKMELVKFVKMAFPFRTVDKLKFLFYTSQCFTILQYAPTLQGPILKIILDRSLELDTEIVIDDKGEVKLDMNEEEMFDLDIEDDVSLTKQKSEESINESADKLDMLMLQIFKYLEKSCSSSTETWKIYHRYIMPIFDVSIVTTHRSKFVQFVIFYLCGHYHSNRTNRIPPFHEDIFDFPANKLYRHFCQKLIEHMLDSKRSSVQRRSCACYLASFLSRANYVDAGTTCEVLFALIGWSLLYEYEGISDSFFLEEGERHPAKVHALFYTVCQSAFYIMCFRWEDVLNYFNAAVIYHSQEENDMTFQYPDISLIDVSPPKWHALCTHPLNPLKFCLESVRIEFIQLANYLELVPSEILDNIPLTTSTKPVKRKKKTSLITTAALTVKAKEKKGNVGGLGAGSNPLESFFPFDPYLLRRSHIFISKYYREWRGLCEDEDDEDVELEEIRDCESVSSSDVEDHEHMPDVVCHSFAEPMSFNSVISENGMTLI